MAQTIIHAMNLEILLERKKNVKNIYVKVMGPDAKIKIVAPSLLSQKYIKEFVAENYNKIIKLRENYIKNNKHLNNTFEAGEIHKLWGREYKLKLIESVNKDYYIEGENIILQLPDIDDFELKKKTLKELYREQIRLKLHTIVAYYCDLMEVEISEYRIKDMKTRWGSCNIKDRRIWLSLKLAMFPTCCLQYVVVHELVHLFERKHSKRFYALVEIYFPEWRNAELMLNGKTRK